METKKTNEERFKELRAETRALKENRKERNRATVWYNVKSGRVELHFKNRTVLCKVTDVDRETSREDSDRMAQGNGYKQVVYQTKDEN